MSDFSLMDAIDCGIVKLPRVPVADNIPGGEMPKFRNLWEHIRTGARQDEGPRPAESARGAPDRARRALRPLRGNIRAVAGERHPGPALLHHRLQQHVDLEARLRLRLWLPPRQRRRLHDHREWAAPPLPQLRRERQPAPPPHHTADRQRAARIGRRARPALPGDGRGRDRPLPTRDRRAYR
jgi:hypothetical protein